MVTPSEDTSDPLLVSPSAAVVDSPEEVSEEAPEEPSVEPSEGEDSEELCGEPLLAFLLHLGTESTATESKH